MKIKRKFIYIAGISLFLLSSCLSIRLRTANENYQQYAYADAIKDFEWVLQRKKVTEAIPLLADCYRQTGNTIKTEYWYKKAVKLPGAEIKWKFYLAYALIQNEKCNEASGYLKDYLSLNRNDLKAKRMLNSCDSMQGFLLDTSLFSIQPIRINMPGENNFSPMFYNSGIVYLSDKNFKGLSKSKSEFTGKRYLDLFYAAKTERGNWVDPEPLRGDVNGRFNEGPAVFTNDYHTMYFTRNNYISNKVDKNKNNINVLKIFSAEKVEGEWKMKGPMPFNSDDYSICHPAINSTGTVIYFSSDIPWGYGGMDIYKVRWEGGNTWSKPVNLGPKVNTEGNELYPFMQNDSTLFFSSDGQPGMGGLDIFLSHYQNDEWQDAENLNSPVNSSNDDFGFIIDSADVSGYFSSNRFAGVDKIFSFKRNQPHLVVNLKLSSDAVSNSVFNTHITIYKDNVKDTLVSIAGLGDVLFKISNNHEYEFKIENRDFYTKKVSMSTMGRLISGTIPLDVNLVKVQLNKPFTWPGIGFNRKEWQLKLDAGEALEKLVELLQMNPLLLIEIGAYTDSRGNDADNMRLTQKRAELVMQYLVTRGIKSARLTAKGYGEAKLLNNCVNGVLCIEEDHQVNNRIEIIVKTISQTALQ